MRGRLAGRRAEKGPSYWLALLKIESCNIIAFPCSLCRVVLRNVRFLCWRDALTERERYQTEEEKERSQERFRFVMGGGLMQGKDVTDREGG